MWVLNQKPTGEYFLKYDREARRNGRRGLWERIGSQADTDINRLIKTNEQQGYICLNDNEGGVRALILED